MVNNGLGKSPIDFKALKIQSLDFVITEKLTA